MNTVSPTISVYTGVRETKSITHVLKINFQTGATKITELSPKSRPPRKTLNNVVAWSLDALTLGAPISWDALVDVFLRRKQSNQRMDVVAFIRSLSDDAFYVAQGSDDYALMGIDEAVTACITLDDASHAVREYIEKYQLSSSSWQGGNVYQHGKLIALIAYNGKVFPVTNALF